MPEPNAPPLILLRVGTTEGELWAHVEAKDPATAMLVLLTAFTFLPSVGGRCPPVMSLQVRRRIAGRQGAPSLTVLSGFNVLGNAAAWRMFGMSAQLQAALTLGNIEEEGRKP